MTRAAIAVLLLVSTIAILAACRGGDSEEAPPAEQPKAATQEQTTDEAAGDTASAGDEEEEASGEPSVAPLRQRTVEIYFPSAKSDGLVPESREIFDTATPGDRVKQIINDLLSGPTGPDALRALPASARLRQVYVLDGGVAYLDFGSELSQGLGGGSDSELLTLYSIINSVVLNVPEVSRVGILLNGRQADTLDGHIDIRHPLPAHPDLIHGSIRADAPASTEARPLAARLDNPGGDE